MQALKKVHFPVQPVHTEQTARRSAYRLSLVSPLEDGLRLQVTCADRQEILCKLQIPVLHLAHRLGISTQHNTIHRVCSFISTKRSSILTVKR